MERSALRLLADEQLLSAVRKSRRDLRELAATSAHSTSENTTALFDEIIDLSVDDVRVGQWPSATANRFLVAASTLALDAVDAGGSSEGRGLPMLQQIADLLCCVAVAAAQHVDGQATAQVCRAWFRSRVASGLAPHEIPAFTEWAVAELRPLGLQDDQLANHVNQEIIKYLTERLSVQQTGADSPQVTPASQDRLKPTPIAPEPVNFATPAVSNLIPDEDPHRAPTMRSVAGSRESDGSIIDFEPMPPASEDLPTGAIRSAMPNESVTPEISGAIHHIESRGTLEKVLAIEQADDAVLLPQPTPGASTPDDAVTATFASEIAAQSVSLRLPEDAPDQELQRSFAEKPQPELAKVGEALGIGDQATKPTRKTIRNWPQLFRTGKDVDEGLGIQIENLLQLAVLVESQVRRPVDDLVRVKKEHARWLESGVSTSSGVNIGFQTGPLATASQAAAAIAERLLTSERPHEAFKAGNAFAEVARMLVPRNREKYANLLERLVSVCFQSVTDSWRFDLDRANANRVDDIEELSKHLEQMARYALGAYFRNGDRTFRLGRLETAQLDRVVNPTLARHFDLQLRYLLESNRPLVREYVRTNMPQVYRLKLPEEWNAAREEWKRRLVEAGYEDVVRLLRDMGDLVDPNQVGQVAPGRRDEIVRASALSDYARVCELLADSAKEIRTYLYTSAQRLLEYREPPRPTPRDDRARQKVKDAQRHVRANDSRGLDRALVEFQSAWQLEIDNLELQDWVAYLEAKTGNLAAAEQKLEQLRRKRAPRSSFATDWNLAVLKYERKNEADAYTLLAPLLDTNTSDESLVLVVLALSLKLDDGPRFLATVPQIRHLQYHPTAITIAHELNNTQRVAELLTQLTAHWHGKWELPSLEQMYNSLDDMKQKVVNKAIVEGQLEQLVSWLEARIRLNRSWIPNHVALAEVLEKQREDNDGAFRVLRNRLEVERKLPPKPDEDPLRRQRMIDRACEDLLNFCRRAKRQDLGRQAYELSTRANARDDLLRSFGQFAPADNIKEDNSSERPVAQEQPQPLPSPQIRDPRLAERFMWVNAKLVQIRNVSSYVEWSKEIEDFTKIASEVSPGEAGEVVKIINNITGVIETFDRTDGDNPDDRVTRRTLYTRVNEYGKQLAQLLRGGVLSQQLATLIMPYSQAIQQVGGDMSRRAGVGPDLEVAIESPFISLENPASTLVLRVTGKSERPVTDVTVDMISESPLLSIAGSRRRHIPRLESERSELLSVPFERTGVASASTIDNATIAVSLRASAEGYADVDLGIKKLTVPVDTFHHALGLDHIPKLFQESPLRPSAPELFQGRGGLLSNIRNSFSGGIQRQRYFFDGIRRVGKTTILNFLPDYVSDSVVPVIANFETFGVRGRFSSAIVLHRFCTMTADVAATAYKVTIDVPDRARFDTDPGRAFEIFLAEAASALPGKVPLFVIDEFQELLQEIAATGPAGSRDTLVLDQIRGHLDGGRLCALFTGSVRFDRLTEIADHRILGSLAPLSVSFLSAESVGAVLRTGLEQWARVPPETVAQVHRLTGGYPWLVQKYGLALVDLLNSEHRTVATPKDVEDVTREKIVWDDTLFEFWWPKDQLGADEERFVELVLRKYTADQQISVQNFLADVGSRERPTFRRAYENLRAAEVFDSTQTEYLQFSGTVLRRWLEQHVVDGQLHVRKNIETGAGMRGQAGIFIDHENLIKYLEKISVSRSVEVPLPSDPTRLAWFSAILKKLLAEAEVRVGRLVDKVTVSFWDRQNEARISKAYHESDFQLKAPIESGKGNEVDFKMADEARRACERARREGTVLARAIIVTGDCDLSEVVRGLKNDGVAVQVWGGSRNTGDMYINVVGVENFVYLDDICGL